jgi:hypothetical protein
MFLGYFLAEIFVQEDRDGMCEWGWIVGVVGIERDSVEDARVVMLDYCGVILDFIVERGFGAHLCHLQMWEFLRHWSVVGAFRAGMEWNGRKGCVSPSRPAPISNAHLKAGYDCLNCKVDVKRIMHREPIILSTITKKYLTLCHDNVMVK